jgi:hypothetical protein
MRTIRGGMPVLGHYSPETMSQGTSNSRINTEFGRKAYHNDFVNAFSDQLTGERRAQKRVAKFLSDAHVFVFDHQIFMQGMPRL